MNQASLQIAGLEPVAHILDEARGVHPRAQITISALVDSDAVEVAEPRAEPVAREDAPNPTSEEAVTEVSSK